MKSAATSTAVTLGERLRYVRGSSTQKAQAAALQIALSSYQHYERDERLPDAEFLGRLLRDGWSIHWLLTGEGPERVEQGSPEADAQLVAVGNPADAAVAEAQARGDQRIADIGAVMREAAQAALTAVQREVGAEIDQDVFNRACAFVDEACDSFEDLRAPGRAQLVAAVYDVMLAPGRPSAAQLIRLISNAIRLRAKEGAPGQMAD